MNFLREMFVYIQHDNEVSDQGLGELKEVFDRIASRPVVNTIVDPEIFRDYIHDKNFLEEKEMTNENEAQEAVVVTVPVVSEYMEYVSNDDREGAKEYLVKFFGSDGNEDQEGLAEFSKAVMEASQAKTEAALDEAAVGESTEVEEATEEVADTAEAMVEEVNDPALPMSQAGLSIHPTSE